MTKGQIIGKTHWKINKVEGPVLPNRKGSMHTQKLNAAEIAECYKNLTLPYSRDDSGKLLLIREQCSPTPFSFMQGYMTSLGQWYRSCDIVFWPRCLRSWHVFSNLFFLHVPSDYSALVDGGETRGKKPGPLNYQEEESTDPNQSHCISPLKFRRLSFIAVLCILKHLI